MLNGSFLQACARQERERTHTHTQNCSSHFRCYHLAFCSHFPLAHKTLSLSLLLACFEQVGFVSVLVSEGEAFSLLFRCLLFSLSLSLCSNCARSLRAKWNEKLSKVKQAAVCVVAGASLTAAAAALPVHLLSWAHTHTHTQVSCIARTHTHTHTKLTSAKFSKATCDHQKFACRTRARTVNAAHQ